ncbi:FxsB family cyclophane-forming radical SAM/SPASM peptide maturase [Actinoplanes sp. NPDC049668]|uniref:FxsB family cyclophane-forming radical SAM/SPASM peptide maturase n=1 Tax=unclassified Actinoplanes TaxID=2626549 RepID=UPI0033BD85E6
MRTSAPRSPHSARPDHPPWPYDLLDVPALRRKGWRPTAIREFVLKVHQRCNLACDYCYVYELADQSWRDRPTMMSAEIGRAAAGRIGEHAREHGLDRVSVILHGGEPLLAGADRLARLIGDLRGAMPDGCELSVGMQTNAVTLDEPTLARLSRERVRIGVSVDGRPEDHDLHRRFRSGLGSHAAVDRALALLGSARFRPSFAGLLCTVNPAADPVATYTGLLEHAPPAIDFLLPHANWAAPPSRPPGQATPHGDWLSQVFDRWYGAPRQETRVRLFEEIMSLLLGGSSRSDQVGLSPVAVAVIETDGAIEQVDSLKSAYSGACDTGLNVLTDPFDAALRHPGFVARQIGLAALSDECGACPIHRICGGGHYAHRYRPGEGFRNPTVYCADMRVLIEHIRHQVSTDLTR